MLVVVVVGFGLGAVVVVVVGAAGRARTDAAVVGGAVVGGTVDVVEVVSDSAASALQITTSSRSPAEVARNGSADEPARTAKELLPEEP